MDGAGGRKRELEEEEAPASRSLKVLKSHVSDVSLWPAMSPPPPEEFDSGLNFEVPPSPMTALYRPTVDQNTKYVVVSGGVCSSLGKGVTTSSIGALLRGHGFRVTAIKMDPYLNIDAGLMSPYEHGEVFVLDDGGETDLDLGNYERMMFLSLGRDNNITTGKIYDSIIRKERRGDYLGKTVQVIPHVTGEIIEWINRTARDPVDGSTAKPQICLIELGGTVGDIESMPFIEALRQFKFSLPEHSLAWCHCSYVPEMSGQKTKPTQHSVKALLALGVQPDIIVCRSSEPLGESTKKKIANQCNIPMGRILSAHDVNNLFHVPAVLQEQHIVGLLNGILSLDELDVRSTATRAVPDNSIRTTHDWRRFAAQVDEASKAPEVVIAFVGKYNQGGSDAYQSVIAALHHSAVEMKRKLKIDWVDATDLEAGSDKAEQAKQRLEASHGIFVPGGFGDRGIEGKGIAAGIARRSKIPYLGVCLGMQVAIIQFAKEVLELKDATSEEFDKNKQSKNHVILFMPEISKETMGANMRLGARWVEFPDYKTSAISSLYGGADRVMERHRHRYEFNIAYKERFEQAGLLFTGQDENKERMDVIELPRSEHPFYIGVQYHPEYKSRPGQPSPPFYGFVAAACDPKNVGAVLEARRKAGPNNHWTPFEL
mmetsp:Transcript_78629/g.163439  ORF Transcript_78629/g.163439 Transcript_78629/m.163439 type:complete len:656 (-) Transcript_78629:65-2032(-)|eukprot:CAMPEP_0206552056 /NCGR_PEP_ID=MMETSP0325_2-20121206/15865_1 /ASSEMBLY_ACC=CAM_ASM_000347 /TAXON_ID=2866 /ORGANISM="Crypthecodinium cohnii, Strain Seligo" /LENGTH=655 /DNA_ID=CAMNT_0054051881 /DNA_START=293 /DNA_END=2260 /DNA_ORIENTATION=+